MIRLIPLEKSNDLCRLCTAYGVAYRDTVHAYVSADPALKAECIFNLNGYRVSLLALDYDSDDVLLEELLIRAVASYAGNRNGYLFDVNDEVGEPIQSTLMLLGFEKDKNGYNGKVPKILEGSCRCKKNQ